MDEMKRQTKALESIAANLADIVKVMKATAKPTPIRATETINPPLGPEDRPPWRNPGE